MAKVAEWRDREHTSYSLNKRNGVHFVMELAEVVGLKVNWRSKLFKKLKSFFAGGEGAESGAGVRAGFGRLRTYHYRHPGEGRDLTLSSLRTGEIPAFAGMTDKVVAENQPTSDFMPNQGGSLSTAHP